MPNGYWPGTRHERQRVTVHDRAAAKGKWAAKRGITEHVGSIESLKARKA